jgi:ribose 5-phosphate isomerase A
MSAADPQGAIARQALDYIQPGMVVGLGTGRAATAFIHKLGERVQAGLRVRGIPTSDASAQLARSLNIPLITLDDVDQIDVDVDGADEVDPQCNVIKGYGGALVREKIVAAASQQFIVLVGEEKLVPVLGSRGKLPVEAIPFGLAATVRHLKSLGLIPQQRMANGQPYMTDNGNVILDCGTGPIASPQQFDAAILAVPGVVGTGLFVSMADVVLVQRGEQVEVRERGASAR